MSWCGHLGGCIAPIRLVRLVLPLVLSTALRARPRTFCLVLTVALLIQTLVERIAALALIPFVFILVFALCLGFPLRALLVTLEVGKLVELSSDGC